ncbi:REDY-like protein HapK [compost metagenome]
MQTVIVLFNLKPGVSAGEYEAWARASDLPVVNALPSVDRFEVLKSSGLLIGDGKPPYDYIEIIRIPDMAAFGKDLGDPAVQAGAAQFQQYADNPLFILTSAL